jgi:hypothetical protein
VTTAIQPAPDAETISKAQGQVKQLTERILRLSAQDLPEAEYFRDFLQQVVQTLAAAAGFVWRTMHGSAQNLECKVGNPALHLTPEEERKRFDILRRAEEQNEPAILNLRGPATGLPSWDLLYVPIKIRQKAEAVLEVWIGPNRSAQALPRMGQYLSRLADMAAVYLSRKQNPTPSDPELWSRLDAFTRRIHSSLDLTEVSLRVANEGRLLIGCDRISVAVRRGSKAVIEAVSGTDTVEPRANVIQRLTLLCTAVLKWGEKLTYAGARDATLPNDVLAALDDYLEVSFGKLLIVYPLPDEREKEREREGEAKRPYRGLLVAENFTTTQPAETVDSRLEVLGRHIAPALYNSSSYRRLPLGWIWKPLAALQEGLRMRAKLIVGLVVFAVVALILILTLVPYPLRMEAKGQLLPQERRWIYAPVEGQIVRFEEGVVPGAQVAQDQSLVLMRDLQLEARILQLNAETLAAQNDIDVISKLFNSAANETDRLRLSADRRQKEAQRDRYSLELRTLRERTNAERAHPGQFWLKAPIAGTVLNWDFRETLTNRLVKPSEPLLRIGDKNRLWEVELRIPQKHMGHVIRALRQFAPRDLDVDLLLLSEPTKTYKGKLSLARVAGEAAPQKDQPTDPEPVVLASVRLDGPDIPPERRLPQELLVAGTDLNARIDCGPRAMGYSLFYGVWEFIYEHLVFPF